MRNSRKKTYLASHDGVGRNVPDLADGSSIARAQVLDDLQILRTQVEVELYSDLELCGCILRLAVPRVTETSVLGSWGWFGSGGCQSEALDILALHGARRKAVGHVARCSGLSQLVCGW